MINISKKRELLKSELIENLTILETALETLRYSYEKCQGIGIKEGYTYEELESYEALNSRFARIADILTQKVLKTIFLLLQESPGGFIDKVNLAEKLEIIESSEILLEIRELRNQIAHEYRILNIQEIFADVLHYTEILMGSVKFAGDYARKNILSG